MTSGVLLRFSQRDCHSYNSGNPIGPEHRCIPPPLASHCSALILRLLVCVCVCVCFVCEKKPGAHTHFLQIIKAQNQSPHPLIYFVRLFRKASLCYSVSFCTGVWVCYCVYVCLYCKMSASTLSLHRILIPKSLQCSNSL